MKKIIDYNYFTVNTNWMEDLGSEVGIFYGLIKNISGTIKEKKIDNKGKVYYRISNKIINCYVDLSKYSIKKLLKILEENNYIKVFQLKYNLETYRYIHFNDYVTISMNGFDYDVFYPLLKKERSLLISSVYSWMIFDINVNKNDCLDFEVLMDSVGIGCSKRSKKEVLKNLIDCGYICPLNKRVKTYKYTQKTIELSNKYNFPWC